MLHVHGGFLIMSLCVDNFYIVEQGFVTDEENVKGRLLLNTSINY